MEHKLTAAIGVFFITTKCTLKCKRCITFTPYQKKHEHSSKETILREIDKFFELYDYIDHFDIEGGESLLHPDLDIIVKKALTYKHKFKRIHILTNCTVLPSKSLIDICMSSNKRVMFLLDNYGELSNKIEELKDILVSSNIPFRIDKYYGDDQYCNGWVDLGNLKFNNYTDNQLQDIFNNCREAHCQAPYIRNGKVFLCATQAAMIEHIPLIKGEYIDLFDDSISIAQKKEIARNFGKLPITTCNYCKGFDVKNGERYPAAEQLD